MIELNNSKKTYLGLTPDGRKRWALDCSIGAIQFRENGGGWQDIDPSVEAVDSDGFSVKFTQVPYLGRIANDSRRRIYPDRTNLDCWIQFDKPFPNMSKPTRHKRWFYWDFPNALMGVRFDNASIKFGFRLKNTNAPASITIPFETQGITRQGRLLYHNGEVIGELRKPVAIDANEEERECEISFAAGEVTISLDTAGLAFPIDIDPSVTFDIPAGSSDSHQRRSDGVNSPNDTIVRHTSGSTLALRYYGGERWASAGFPNMGDTIDVCYVRHYIYSASYDDLYGRWWFQDAAAPAVFTAGVNNISNRPRTTASVFQNVLSRGTGWKNTSSLKAVLQEIVDSYSPTAIALIFTSYNRPGVVAYHSRSFDSNPAQAAELRIEWTEPVVDDHRRSAFLLMF